MDQTWWLKKSNKKSIHDALNDTQEVKPAAKKEEAPEKRERIHPEGLLKKLNSYTLKINKL